MKLAALRHMTQWYPSRSRIRRRWLGVTLLTLASVPQGVDTLIGWVYLEGSESDRGEEQDMKQKIKKSICIACGYWRPLAYRDNGCICTTCDKVINAK